MSRNDYDKPVSRAEDIIRNETMDVKKEGNGRAKQRACMAIATLAVVLLAQKDLEPQTSF